MGAGEDILVTCCQSIGNNYGNFWHTLCLVKLCWSSYFSNYHCLALEGGGEYEKVCSSCGGDSHVCRVQWF